MFLDKEELNLYKWLQSIPIDFSQQDIQLDSDIIEAFSDGLILCQIVSKLERAPVQGIHQKVKSIAAAQHNVKRALDVLKKKKDFPSKFLFCESDIVRGNGEVIRDLLKYIKHSYRNRSTSRKTILKSMSQFNKSDFEVAEEKRKEQMQQYERRPKE